MQKTHLVISSVCAVGALALGIVQTFDLAPRPSAPPEAAVLPVEPVPAAASAAPAAGVPAAETISLLEPRIVIPMHYRTEVSAQDLEPVDRFLKEMGVESAEPQPKLVVTKSSLPSETQVVVLDYRK